MKLVVSSYNKEKTSCTLFDIDIAKKEYKILDEVSLNAPSFIISGDEYIFTYSKEQIKLLSYKIKNDRLIKIDEIYLPGSTLTHLAYNKKYKKLYAASYFDGAYLKVDVKEGMFSNLKYYKQEEGLESKCHCVTISPNEEKVYITNIAQDKIYVYDYELNYLTKYILPVGVGPRHTIIHDEYLYTITEYSNEVLVVNNEGKIEQRVSTIKDYKNKTYGATLLYLDEHIYASNRGLETIAVFKMRNHLLEYEKMIPTYGNHSRHMILTKNQKHIISFNKNSHQISFINIETEKLDLSIPYDNVSCGVEI